MVKKRFYNSVFLSVLICIILIYGGFIKIRDRNPYSSIISSGEITFLEGCLLSTPVKSSSGKTYSAVIEVYATGKKAGHADKSYDSGVCISQGNGRIKLLIPAEMVEAFYPGKLFSSAKRKGAFLWEAGGVYTLKGKMLSEQFLVAECTGSFFPRSLFGRIDFFRALCRLQFKRLMYSWGNGGGLLLALLSGSREYTEVSVTESFKKSGLSHILALSGMHLSMFSGIAMFIGKKIKRKRLSFIIRTVAVVLFVWFAGFSPSLLRAFICNCLLILSALSDNENPDMLAILCFSFLLQTVITPESLFNTGFILSYAALAGILIFNSFSTKIYVRFLPSYFTMSLSSSTSAQIFTAPVSLTVFGTFCPIGIIATSIVSPLITVFIYSGLVLIILSLMFPFISTASGFFVNLQYNIIKIVVGLFSKCPGFG